MLASVSTFIVTILCITTVVWWNVVIKLNTVNHKSLVRDQYGDYKTVKESSLKGITIEELKEELMRNTVLREAAVSEDLIEVGDYHNDDKNYMSYMSSYS